MQMGTACDRLSAATGISACDRLSATAAGINAFQADLARLAILSTWNILNFY